MNDDLYALLVIGLTFAAMMAFLWAVAYALARLSSRRDDSPWE